MVSLSHSRNQPGRCLLTSHVTHYVATRSCALRFSSSTDCRVSSSAVFLYMLGLVVDPITEYIGISLSYTIWKLFVYMYKKYWPIYWYWIWPQNSINSRVLLGFMILREVWDDLMTGLRRRLKLYWLLKAGWKLLFTWFWHLIISCFSGLCYYHHHLDTAFFCAYECVF